MIKINKNYLPIIILIFIIILFLFFSIQQLFFYPYIGPDEAYFADIALNLMNQHRIGTDLWGNMIPGANYNFYWYPPGLFYLLVITFKIFGFSIQIQRYLTIVTSLGLIYIFWRFLQDIINSLNIKNDSIKLGSLFTVLLLFITDPVFLKSSRAGRPEVYVLFLSMIAIYIYYKNINLKKNTKPIVFFIVGFILGTSVLFHLFTFIFIIPLYIHLLVTNKLNKQNYLHGLAYTIGLLIPISFWLIQILPNLNYFQQQLFLQAHYRKDSMSWMKIIFNFTSEIPSPGNYIFYVLTSLAIVSYTIIKKKTQYTFLISIIIFTWIYVFVGKLEWYPVLFIPYVYISFLLFSYDISIKNIKSKINIQSFKLIFFSISIIILIFNLYNFLYIENIYIQSNFNYWTFSNDVVSNIPANSTVYLSTNPELYYAFQGKNYTIHEFPALPTSKEKFIELLNQCDYIVVNESPEYFFLPNQLSKYISNNQSLAKRVGAPDGYSASIIQLKPLNERK